MIRGTFRIFEPLSKYVPLLDIFGMYNNDPVQEVGRCRNPFWLGSPHVNTEDFTYQGQFIPKSTSVICNTVRTIFI